MTPTPTPPDRPAYWGQGLPPAGAARPAPHPAWRAAWMIWSATWALFWITVGWFILPPVNLLAFVASIAAILAFDRMAPRNQLPPPPPRGRGQ